MEAEAQQKRRKEGRGRKNKLLASLIAERQKKIVSQLQQANDQLNSTTQQLHQVTDQLHQANDLISQLQSSSSSGPFGAAMEEEREKRVALEKVCRHREDMIELAKKGDEQAAGRAGTV
jgi:hypothetical protein